MQDTDIEYYWIGADSGQLNFQIFWRLAISRRAKVKICGVAVSELTIKVSGLAISDEGKISGRPPLCKN
jgi:hypothetical protein